MWKIESYLQTEGLFNSVEDVKYNGDPKEKMIEEMHKNHIDKNTFYQEIAILAFTFVVPAAITQKKTLNTCNNQSG